MVIRMIIGRGWGQGPQHKARRCTLGLRMCGLKVVMPATAYDAKGMLIAAVRMRSGSDPRTPLALRRKRCGAGGGLLPLDKAMVRRAGTDDTLIVLYDTRMPARPIAGGVRH